MSTMTGNIDNDAAFSNKIHVNNDHIFATRNIDNDAAFSNKIKVNNGNIDNDAAFSIN
jgi:hypothetical protein